MAIQYIQVDNLQTRIMQSFVNLTKAEPTKYPALSTVQISIPENLQPFPVGNTNVPPLTVVQIYDQFAFRVASLSAGSLQSVLLGA
jgi:hypothetical protein